MRFVDQATIRVRAGDGGKGCISFRREKFVPRGGPDGGDGGDGGSVVLLGDARLMTLADLEYRRFYRAEDGQHGMGKDRHGKNGRDEVVPVPLGTDVFDAQSGVKLGEVLKPGQMLIVARGGKGGRGNARFASPTNQAPRIAEPGEPGEEKELKLVLRLLADVGIVGLPNAGKSTLLAALTSARPKIADYPFTTLTPNLGVLETRNFRWTIADMPGIIKGAHQGKGLGLAFLRHIERTRMLVFVIDATAERPEDDYRQLCEEIERFEEGGGRKAEGGLTPRILERPRLVVMNKIDLLESDALLTGRQALRLDVPVLWVSALLGTGIEELRKEIERQIGGSPQC
ncbi:MAG: GTPase ObgE [candidate division WOR-3 bacterium]